MRIHKEGNGTLIVVTILLIIVNVIVHYFFPNILFVQGLVFISSLVALFFFLYFFRYPNRTVKRNESVIICPADGKVVVIEEIDEKIHFHDKRLQVSIFMSPLNVHANWYPVSGKVSKINYHKGRYLVAWHPKASDDNERSEIMLEMADGINLLVKQIAGAVARRIVFYPHKGDMVKQGAELGFIKFGSRVDLILPLNVKLNVKLNEKVKGGITELGIFN